MKGRLVFLLSLLCVAQALPLSLNGGKHRNHVVRNKRHANREHDIADKEVRTIISAIVDAILDGDRKKRSEIPEEEDELDDITNPIDASGESESGQPEIKSENKTSVLPQNNTILSTTTDNFITSGSGNEDDSSGQQNIKRSAILKDEDENTAHLNIDNLSEEKSEVTKPQPLASAISAEKRGYLEGSSSGEKETKPEIVVPLTRTTNLFSNKTNTIEATASGSGQSDSFIDASGSGENSDASSATDDEIVTDDVIKENAGFIEVTPDVEQKERFDFGRIKRDEDAIETESKKEQILKEIQNNIKNNTGLLLSNTSNVIPNNSTSIPLEKDEVMGSGSGTGSGNMDDEDIMEDTKINIKNETSKRNLILVNVDQTPLDRINLVNLTQNFNEIKNSTNTTAAVNTTVIEPLSQEQESGSGSGSGAERFSEYVKRNNIAKDDEPDNEDVAEDTSTATSTGLFDAIHKSLSNSSETKESAGDALMEEDSPDASGSGAPWDDSSGYGFGGTGGDKREEINKNVKSESVNRPAETVSSGSGMVESGSGSSESENFNPSISTEQLIKNNNSVESQNTKNFKTASSNELQQLEESADQSLVASNTGSGSGAESGSDSNDVSNSTLSGSIESPVLETQGESGSGSGDASNDLKQNSSVSAIQNSEASNFEKDNFEAYASGESEVDKNEHNLNLKNENKTNFESETNDAFSGQYISPTAELSQINLNATANVTASNINNTTSNNLFGSVQEETSNEEEGSGTEASAEEDDEEEMETGESQKETGDELAKKRGKIIEEIVTDMAKAAIQSVEVDDSNAVVKKSDIVPQDSKIELQKKTTRSEIPNRPLADKKMDSSLKQLVRSILKEDVSVRENVERISTQREEDEEKLTQDILSVMNKDENKVQTKDKIISGIKDFEGYVQALSQAESINPSKHNLIAKKLEGDLLKRLSVPVESSKSVLMGEEKLLKDSELEFIKDKISDAKRKSEEYAANHAESLEDVRKHAINLLNPIIDSLPLKKEDIEGLAGSISRSAWVKAVEKPYGKNSNKVRRNIDDVINIT